VYLAYRYGFNGKEKDDDIQASTGVDYDYGFRMYDARIARFLSIDPLTKKYPELTPYQFASNTPIQAIDLDGKEAEIVVGGAVVAAALVTVATATVIYNKIVSHPVPTADIYGLKVAITPFTVVVGLQLQSLANDLGIRPATKADVKPKGTASTLQPDKLPSNNKDDGDSGGDGKIPPYLGPAATVVVTAGAAAVIFDNFKTLIDDMKENVKKN
jgi:RHS repeat-associated protein